MPEWDQYGISPEENIICRKRCFPEKSIKPFDESALELTESTTLKSSTLASPEKENTISSEEVNTKTSFNLISFGELQTTTTRNEITSTQSKSGRILT